MRDTIKVGNNKPKMIAHRGVSKLELENTKEAFLAACNRSYYGVETDVRLTKDSKLILFHDDDLKRLGQLDKRVIDLTLDELNEVVLDNDINYIKSKNRILELEDFLKMMKLYGKVPVIELKGFHDDESIKNIYLKTMKYFSEEEFIFISFHIHYLITAKCLNGNLNIQYLFSEQFDKNLALAKENGFDVDISYTLVNDENIEKIKRLGLKINVWTVDSLKWLEDNEKYDLDFVTTNILE